MKPNVLLVLDSRPPAGGRRRAAFQERIAFDGVLLTKLTATPAAARRSPGAVTGKPVMRLGRREVDQLEVFHPDRMASRILGMGDGLTLIERPRPSPRRAEGDGGRMMAGEMNFDDFLASYRMMRKMGSMKSLIGMLPGRQAAQGRRRRRAGDGASRRSSCP